MARKDNSPTFKRCLEEAKQKKALQEASATESFYLHLFLDEGNPREMDILSQKLSKLKNSQNGYSAAVEDTLYHKRELPEGEIRARRAIILRGSSPQSMQAAIREASQGLHSLIYRVAEF